MPTYKAPLRDLQFVYQELFDPSSLQSLQGLEEVDADLVDSILEEAGRFCETVLQPLNQSGDEEGCHFNNGTVTTPKGFKEAYQAFCENGWSAVTADPTYGGQGLPKTLGMMVEEMICSSNMSFGMYPGLTEGAYNALVKFGTDELKNTYLPNMVTGEWSGTMCLTEPHCGTDLGLVRTKAEPQTDGSYKVTGTKIFISAGEHDLSANIIHLVLARTPDAPAGIKGISLFIVPKYSVNADGSVGAPNGVSCGSIEHKMGIKASATCVMNFDEATGYLVGTLNKGMQAMFQMMNTARLGVGIQGLGLCEVSYQNAVAYARDRLQGRALKAPFQPEKPADPLFVHPDIRRMLLTMRAYTEGNRALAIWVARKLDESVRATAPKQKQSADDFVALMTPIVKAFMTDCAMEVTNLGVQIYGGHGFIREWGMEQFVRDARITPIYEGTNGIQALDLVGRKMAQNTGRLLRPFFHEVSEYLELKASDSNDELQAMIGGLMKAFGRLQQATGFIAQQGLKDPDEAAAAATDYLRLFALVALGYLWLRMAEIALAKRGQGETEFYQAKLDTAQFYFARLLPQTGALLSAILSGSQTLMQFNHEAF